jgi:hypothetical protein
MMPQFKPLVAFVILVLLVPIIIGCPEQNKTPPPASSDSELEDFMAQAIIDDTLEQSGRSPEGSFVAHVTDLSFEDKSVSPLRIWKYEQGHLITGGQEAFQQALFSKQSSDWPPFVFLFAFTSLTPDETDVEVRTYYDMGLRPDSRGGNAAVWKLKKQHDQWTVLSKEHTIFWD